MLKGRVQAQTFKCGDIDLPGTGSRNVRHPKRLGAKSASYVKVGTMGSGSELSGTSISLSRTNASTLALYRSP